jgi:hypothetical protein
VTVDVPKLEGFPFLETDVPPAPTVIVYVVRGITVIAFIHANAPPPPPFLDRPAAPPPHASTFIVVTPSGTVKVLSSVPFFKGSVYIFGDVICEKAAIENNKKNRSDKFFNVE